MTPTRIVPMLLALLVAAPLAAQSPAKNDEGYQPRPGQPGKDVIWLPTPDALVMEMLRSAKVTSADIVFDLGSGDGKIPIAAAKSFGAQATGIEFNPELAEFARKNAQSAGVGNKVQIITGDIFKEDFSKATVVTLYLLPDLNLRLRPMILKMKPGTRVVSHTFHMGEWEPEQTFAVEGHDAHLWIVPAEVAGRWALKEKDGSWEANVDITQQFQRIGGTITRRDKTQPLLGASVDGPQLRFTFVDSDGGVRTVKANVEGNKLDGRLGFVNHTTDIIGTRSPPH